MKEKFGKVLIILTLVFGVFMLNTINVSADVVVDDIENIDTTKDMVAKIGEVEYATLDEAVAASVDGDIITLLDDATTTEGFGLAGKTLTVDGDGHEITFVGKTIYLAKKGSVPAVLNFENCTIDMTQTVGTPTISGESYGWASIILNFDCKLNLTNVDLKMDGSSVDNSVACYMHYGAGMTLINSTMSAENYAGNGFSTDDGNYNVFVTMDNSSVTLNKNRTGFNSNYVITVKNESYLAVTNSRGHGSNGADYFIDNSTVFYDSNGTHGMSARNVIITNGSDVTSNNNKYYGVYVNGAGNFLVDGTSKLTANYNAATAGAGVRLMPSETKTGTVLEGGTIVIDGNYAHGLYNARATVFEEGSNVEIMLNYDKTNGGGIYNTGNLSLPSNAMIYNNHADVNGDDIYSTGVLTLGNVGTDWFLDGEPDCYNTETEEYSLDLINGWFEDGYETDENENPLRWQAHAETNELNHIVLYAGQTFTSEVAIKAAHNLTGEVVSKYVDEEYNEIADSETTTGYVGEDYTTYSKDIENYELVRVEGNEEGTYDVETITVTYVYHYITGDVKVHYVVKSGDEYIPFNEFAYDDKGNLLPIFEGINVEDITLTGKVGEQFETTYEVVEGLTLDGLYVGNLVTDGNDLNKLVNDKFAGEFKRDVQEFTYVFEINTGSGEDYPLPPQTGYDMDVNTNVSVNMISLILLIGAVYFEREKLFIK